MRNVGSFQIVSELYRTAFASVYMATYIAETGPSSLPKDVIVKIFEPHIADEGEITGEVGEPMNGASRAFLEGVEVQKRVAGRGHWAPIHDSGISESRPFYVTSYYPRTAQKLLSGRMNLSASALHEIIIAVVLGLVELKQTCGRPHGNIKPSNVLIGGRGELAGDKIVLTDLAFSAARDTATEAADVYAVGELLYQLIVLRPFKAGAWPIDRSAEWSKLGRRAGKWHQLCKDLLDPNESQRPSLEAMHERIQSLGVRRISGTKLGHSLFSTTRLALRTIPWGKVLTPLVAVAAGVFGIHVLQSSTRNDFLKENQAWLGNVLQDPDRLKRLDAALGDSPIVPPAELADIESCRQPGGQSWASIPQLMAAYRAKSDATRIHARLLELLARTRQRAIDLSDHCHDLGWTQPAGYFKSIAANSPADADLAAIIDTQLSRLDRLAIPASLESQFRLLDTSLIQVQSRHDLDLTAFAAVLRSNAVNSINVADSGWKPTQALPEVDLGAKLASKIRALNWPADFDRDRMAKDQPKAFDHPAEADIDIWVQTVDQFTLAKGPELAERKQAVTAWQRRLDAIDADVKAAPSEWFLKEGDKAAFDAQHAAVKADIANLINAKYLRTEVAAKPWLQSQLDTRLDGLRHFQTDNLSVLAAQWRNAAFTSTAVQLAWFAYLNDLTARVAGMDAAMREKTRKESTDLRDLLQKWDTEFNVPDAIPSGDFKKLAEDEREHRLEPLMTGVSPIHLPDPQQMQKSADDFAAWCRQLAALAADFPLRDDVLTSGQAKALRERWPGTGESAEFWQKHVLTTGDPLNGKLADDLNRLNALSEVMGSSDWTKLRGWASYSKSRAEIVLAAWERLRDPAVKAPQPWPVDQKDLPADTQLRTNLLTAVKASKAPAAPGDDPVKTAARNFWEQVNKQAATNDLKQAASAFSTAVDSAEGLTPPAIFTLALYRARLGDPAAPSIWNDAALDSVLTQFDRLTPADQFAVKPLVDQLRQKRLTAATPGDKPGYLWPSEEEARKTAEAAYQVKLRMEAQAKLIEIRNGVLTKANDQLTQGDPQSALDTLKKALPPAPDKIAEIQVLMAAAAKNRLDAEAARVRGESAGVADLLSKAAEGGDPQAMYELGILYRTGNAGMSVPRDPLTAVAWLERAAKRNVTTAWEPLGEMYEKGDGAVKKDEPRALECYKNAGADPVAMNRMALLYIHGTRPNLDAAKAIFQQLAARDDTSAMPARIQLIRMALDHGDPNGAADALDAADKKDPNHSTAELAGMMRELAAQFEKSNDGRTRGWYERAAGRGDKAAQDWIQRVKAVKLLPPKQIP